MEGLSRTELIERLRETEKTIYDLKKPFPEPKEYDLENRMNNVEEVLQEFDKKLSKVRWDILSRDTEIEKLRNRNLWIE